MCGNDAAIVRGAKICGDGESGIGKREDCPALHEPVRVDVTLRNFKRANGATGFDGQNFDAGRNREFIVLKNSIADFRSLYILFHSAEDNRDFGRFDVAERQSGFQDFFRRVELRFVRGIKGCKDVADFHKVARFLSYGKPCRKVDIVFFLLRPAPRARLVSPYFSQSILTI